MRKFLTIKDKEELKNLIDMLSINYDGFQPDIDVELNDESYSVDENNKATTNIELKIIINTLQKYDDEE